jgi:hypothetical protein
MQDLSFLKQFYYQYLGWTYRFTYWTRQHQFLGVAISRWFKLLSLALVLLAWIWDWNSILLVLTLLLAGWVQLVYWQARRAGYSKFIPQETTLPPDSELVSLPADERVGLRATGVFSVKDREKYVVLRPAEYWQVPLGDHIVMVQEAEGRFLYQFFSAATLQEVRTGWLIFGTEPIDTLAITFLARQGIDYDDSVDFFYVSSNHDSDPAAQKRTIYFSFENSTQQRKVWHNIVRDARRVRS